MLDTTQLNLELVVDNIRLIEHRFQSIKTVSEFVDTDNGLTTLDAIAMRLQFIGECIKRIDKTDSGFFETHPSVEWNKIINLRDFISHHYEMLNHEIIFNICSVYLPQLKISIQQLLTQ